jgi:hypothetical protein
MVGWQPRSTSYGLSNFDEPGAARVASVPTGSDV